MTILLTTAQLERSFQKRRQKRKPTIKQVSNILKIPQYVLKDIEEGTIMNVSCENSSSCLNSKSQASNTE
ncbi:MAG TPA: hypothetical protein EYP21_02735 [Syntrophaceae bacterium]|nr:hypothetical protein [Syntrophaceae bacterium]